MPAVCTKNCLQTLSHNYNRHGEEQQMCVRSQPWALSLVDQRREFICSRSDGRDQSFSTDGRLYSQAAFSLRFTQKSMQTAQRTPLAFTALDDAQKLKENLLKD